MCKEHTMREFLFTCKQMGTIRIYSLTKMLIGFDFTFVFYISDQINKVFEYIFNSSQSDIRLILPMSLAIDQWISSK